MSISLPLLIVAIPRLTHRMKHPWYASPWCWKAMVWRDVITVTRRKRRVIITSICSGAYFIHPELLFLGVLIKMKGVKVRAALPFSFCADNVAVSEWWATQYFTYFSWRKEVKNPDIIVPWKDVTEHMCPGRRKLYCYSIESWCGFLSCRTRHFRAINPTVLLFYLLRLKKASHKLYPTYPNSFLSCFRTRLKKLLNYFYSITLST